MTLDLDRDGLVLLPGLLSSGELDLVERHLATIIPTLGVRIFGNPALAEWLKYGPVGSAARSTLGQDARPVRAILFDKNPDANWSLGWHQDRTIAVRERADVPGFAHWTRKAGVTHVEPPFTVIEDMLTARIHLDPVDENNAPLLAAPGSHRLGRILESEIPEIVERCGAVECMASEGDVWLYRTALLHASERSRSDARRRVLQVDFSSVELPNQLEWLGVG